MVGYGQSQFPPRVCREEQDAYDAGEPALTPAEAHQRRRACDAPDPQQQQRQLMHYLRRILPLRNSEAVPCKRSDEANRSV